MRGLPPPPVDVLQCVFTFDVNGDPCTTWHWMFCPGAELLDYTELRTVWTAVTLHALSDLVPLMSASGHLRTCRLSRLGSARLDVVDDLAPNNGAGSGHPYLNLAMGLHWTSSGARDTRRAVTRLPAVPSEFADDAHQVNELGWSELGARGLDFLADVNSTPSPAGGNLALGTVRRQSAGVPLPSAVFVPFDAVVPVRRLATLHRRITQFRS